MVMFSWLTKVHGHSDGNYHTEDVGESGHEEYDGYDYINEGWQDLK